MTAGWAAEIKRAGYALAVYTVNDPARAKVLVGWGADAIITDRPDVIAAAIQTAAGGLARPGQNDYM